MGRGVGLAGSADGVGDGVAGVGGAGHASRRKAQERRSEARRKRRIEADGSLSRMPIERDDVLRELGLEPEHSGACAGGWIPTGGEWLESVNPATGERLGRVRQATAAEYETVAAAAHAAFLRWREVPAPQRGDVVRKIADAFRKKKDALGALISMEVGKILPEGAGEVQEIIDIADFAAGLSRQLYGKTMHSERARHRMYEQWHPLGVVGVISAFNFPAAVWSWNAILAAVCGDAVLWKPSRKAPLTAIACQKIAHGILAEAGHAGVMSLVIGGDADVGERMLDDRRIALVSATGSTNMGRRVAEVVGRRLGKTLLELGGNNAVIVLDDADLELASRAIAFGAVGTAGQRCTSVRRVLMQRGIAGALTDRLRKTWGQVKIGNPLHEGVLMGPLIDGGSVERMLAALATSKAQGGEVLFGGARVAGMRETFVQPTLVRAKKEMPILREEVFAPLLHLVEIDGLDEAIEIHNDVPQGLSSAIFTTRVKSAERFLSAIGSDCGIANVNLGTSGAEIGGAFGGEKDTGGGRESGSDSWQAYMRRQTSTINWGDEMPLAQGIRFGE